MPALLGSLGLRPRRPTPVSFCYPHCWTSSAYGLGGQLQFHFAIMFITFCAICSLSSIDGARFWDCLFLSGARRDILRPNCRAGASRQAEKRSRPRLRPRIPTFTRLKPSQDRDGPPCQVWGRWDQRCGRPLITYIHTHTHIWQIYIRFKKISFRHCIPMTFYPNFFPPETLHPIDILSKLFFFHPETFFKLLNLC